VNLLGLSPQSKGSRILVVGTAPRSRLRTAATLRAHGYNVTEAGNADEAQAAASSFAPGLLVLDVAIPAVDGWEFRQAQQASPQLRTIPTMVAAPIVEADMTAMLPPSILVLYKPYDDTELVEVVDSICTAPIPPLMWSRRGEIACADHAPVHDSARWAAEAWEQIPANLPTRTPYQCQHCSGAGPLQHRSNGRSAGWRRIDRTASP
jgi:CheY-like chemotaxis protein